MPYLTRPIDENGAAIEIKVGVIDARRAVLKKHRMRVPERVRVWAVIDTGASCSAISHEVFEALDERPTGTVKVIVPSESPEPQEFQEFAVSISLLGPGDVELYLPIVSGVISCDFSGTDGCQALIGRDVLRHCLFVYDGSNEVFSLAF